jgi:NADH-quinone oxidoreductase subunit G
MSGENRVGLSIDGVKVVVPECTNVLRAAEQAGVAIPHFCYHAGLTVDGSCRMCLVEIEGLPKLELACATVVREGMVVRTSTERVREARKDVLAFFLAEHPLDCPICDKAGECLLQDYDELHGQYASRMRENRERREKMLPIGRGLILDRERCVLCTRCIRFLQQVTKTGELGMFERAVRSEVGIFDGAPVDNNYSGNLVDVCPVGAITARDFRFKTRAWFLARKPSVCPHCSRGCAVVVESVAGYPLRRSEKRVYRVTAGENPAVNGFWICDLGRDGRHDIDDGRTSCLVKKGAQVTGLSWPAALAEVADAVRAIPGPERAASLAVVLNSRLTCEELALARALFTRGLGLDRVYFADPKPGAGDDLLLTPERVPNSRGVIEAGFAPRLPGLHELAASSVALIFGTGLAANFPEEALAGALAEIPAKYVFAAHAAPLDRLADIVFPVAVPAEKSGTYINVDGLRQTFARAVEPPPGVTPEGGIFAALARALGLDLGDADAR